MNVAWQRVVRQAAQTVRARFEPGFEGGAPFGCATESARGRVPVQDGVSSLIVVLSPSQEVSAVERLETSTPTPATLEAKPQAGWHDIRALSHSLGLHAVREGPRQQRLLRFR